MRDSFALIGLGNILLQDEGVGVHAVEALRKKFIFSEEIVLLDGGTLGLDLLPYLEGKEKVLFVDAVDWQKEPGHIGVLEDDAIPSFLKPALSFHQVGLADLLFASTLLGTKPANVVLIGVQPAEIEAGLTLSEPVHRQFGPLLKTLLDKLQEWGVRYSEKSGKEP
jgi:hydrogenase maturation protease